jgi:hypothetical protein
MQWINSFQEGPHNHLRHVLNVVLQLNVQQVSICQHKEAKGSLSKLNLSWSYFQGSACNKTSVQRSET